MPALARALRPRPSVEPDRHSLGTVYRGADGGPLILIAGERSRDPEWLASSLAKQLGAVAVVVATPSADAMVAAGAAAADFGADDSHVALIGVGDGATAALATAADGGRGFRVDRLVLLSPTNAAVDAAHDDLIGVPPVFLQSAPGSLSLPVSRSIELGLREWGVAVRPVEYAGLHEAWTRYPGLAPGSARALADIVAFLRRGFGVEGSFGGTIPGWDLK
jgi:acetyl esterase/lipase